MNKTHSSSLLLTFLPNYHKLQWTYSVSYNMWMMIRKMIIIPDICCYYVLDTELRALYSPSHLILQLCEVSAIIISIVDKETEAQRSSVPFLVSFI